MTVKELILDMIERSNYDGLFNSAFECACITDEGLEPCGDMALDCEAGFKTHCKNCGNKELIGYDKTGMDICYKCEDY